MSFAMNNSEEPRFIGQKTDRISSAIEKEERIAELIAELLYEYMIKKSEVNRTKSNYDSQEEKNK